MTLPILDLPASCTTNPTRLDVAKSEAIMLWPDDPAERARARASAFVQFGRDLMRRGMLPNDLIAQLADLAVDAPRPADLIEAAHNQFVRGMVSGIVVYRAIGYQRIDAKKAAITRNVEEMSKLFWRRYRLRPQTIHNTVLPTFRPVSHFWAAYVKAAFDEHYEFPCKVAGLP
jgi:hypothetical protein